MNRDDIPLPQGYEIHELPADYNGSLFIEGQMRQFAELVAAAEREECAKAVERSVLYIDGSHGVSDRDWHIAERVTAHCAAAIRARGE